jgi:hypothetical protein
MNELDWAKAAHHPERRTSFGDPDTARIACVSCGGLWPCITGILIAEIERLTKENADLLVANERQWNLLVGYWHGREYVEQDLEGETDD